MIFNTIKAEKGSKHVVLYKIEQYLESDDHVTHSVSRTSCPLSSLNAIMSIEHSMLGSIGCWRVVVVDEKRVPMNKLGSKRGWIGSKLLGILALVNLFKPLEHRRIQSWAFMCHPITLRDNNRDLIRGDLVLTDDHHQGSEMHTSYAQYQQLAMS